MTTWPRAGLSSAAASAVSSTRSVHCQPPHLTATSPASVETSPGSSPATHVTQCLISCTPRRRLVQLASANDNSSFDQRQLPVKVKAGKLLTGVPGVVLNLPSTRGNTTTESVMHGH